MTDWVDRTLLALEGKTLLRRLVGIRPLSAVEVDVAGRHTVLFSSNDYLGLSQHPEVCRAVADTALERGMGNRGAALICGYSELHEALEAELADLKGTEASLLFPTGYQANVGLLSALASEDTVFYSDALNHASIIDGIRLSRCPVRIFDHLDMDHLERLLATDIHRRKIIVTDGLFSMDGDVAPLRQLAELKTRAGAMLIVDEAHATLLYGQDGGGLVKSLGVHTAVDFQVGTLSKAVGAQGGFVATSQRLRRWLLNTARAFIFTTALPAPVVAGARAAIDVATRDRTLRDRLWARVAQLAAALGRPLQSPIAPIILGDETAALQQSQALLQQGFHVTAIRPPTVPKGTSRLRIALSAAHSAAQVEALVEALDQSS